jgi:subtilisin
MGDDGRKKVIITFKPKDERPEGDRDKLEIVASAVEERVQFFDAAAAAHVAGMPEGLPPERVGIDINEYEAPIVITSLTEGEADALRDNDNVAMVEDDEPCWAIGSGPADGGMAEGGGGTIAPSHPLLVEGTPSPLAEMVPVGVSQVKAPQAWSCSRGGRIPVAILDTGIDSTHPDLAPNDRGGISFVPSESSPEDLNGHGTHCAGTVAAARNGSGVVGVAPAASIHAVKVLDQFGSGAFSNVIAGIDWAIKRRIKIVSMSLGGPSAPSALEAMCNAAWAKGLLLVAAAGNTGPGSGTVGYPAKYANVIAVSAIDSSNVIASFSSRGPEVELCAPGVSVRSTLPGGLFGPMSGTSMACPHVAGVAALAWGGHRYASNVTLRRLLAWTADNLGAPGRDDEYGYGRVDAGATCALAKPPAIPGIP